MKMKLLSTASIIGLLALSGCDHEQNETVMPAEIGYPEKESTGMKSVAFLRSNSTLSGEPLDVHLLDAHAFGSVLEEKIDFTDVKYKGMTICQAIEEMTGKEFVLYLPEQTAPSDKASQYIWHPFLQPVDKLKPEKLQNMTLGEFLSGGITMSTAFASDEIYYKDKEHFGSRQSAVTVLATKELLIMIPLPFDD